MQQVSAPFLREQTPLSLSSPSLMAPSWLRLLTTHISIFESIVSSLKQSPEQHSLTAKSRSEPHMASHQRARALGAMSLRKEGMRPRRSKQFPLCA